MTEFGDFQALLAPRRIDSHKGDFGHVLVIAGSPEKPGAGVLASGAVLKSGAGLATAAVPWENRAILVQAHPELMLRSYRELSDLVGNWQGFSAVLAGPGLGDTPAVQELVADLLKNVSGPLVLDADGLNGISGRLELLKSRRMEYPLVLTPHPKEFSRLTNLSTAQIHHDRVGIARSFAATHGVYLILKGHHTILATPDGQVYLNPTGNPGMATAGSGDVLSGLIAGFLGQFFAGYPVPVILQAALFLHGFAGDLAAGEYGEMGMTAGDILAFIPRAIRSSHDFQSPIQLA
jgi:ADP-dependent NAD(P)H-hydrate dehydratase / NAD(P)H-hydrate epimerase